MSNTKLALTLLAASIALIGCGESIPSQWRKGESKDAFTDKITKQYDLASNESSSNVFSVACSKGGDLNFYVEYPSRTGIPSAMTEVTIRVGAETPFTEKWYVGWVNGSTTIENPASFFEKISSKSKLAIEIFAETRSTYNIAGIENVVADMEASVCKFKRAAPSVK